MNHQKIEPAPGGNEEKIYHEIYQQDDSAQTEDENKTENTQNKTNVATSSTMQTTDLEGESEVTNGKEESSKIEPALGGNEEKISYKMEETERDFLGKAEKNKFRRRSNSQ